MSDIVLSIGFDDQIGKLCSQAAACQSERDAVEITRRIQALIRAHVEELRSNLATLQAVFPSEIVKTS